MQKKVWYYEKWVGRHGSFPPRRSVKIIFQISFIFPKKIRSKGEYRTPPVVAPPQVPSNYAPNYPMQPPPQPQQQVYQKGPGKQYGTLPHPQVKMKRITDN